MLRLEAFDIVSCERPSLALEQAEGRSFDIVISDFRMPEMTGIALMEKLADLIPLRCAFDVWQCRLTRRD